MSPLRSREENGISHKNQVLRAYSTREFSNYTSTSRNQNSEYDSLYLGIKNIEKQQSRFLTFRSWTFSLRSHWIGILKSDEHISVCSLKTEL